MEPCPHRARCRRMPSDRRVSAGTAEKEFILWPLDLALCYSPASASWEVVLNSRPSSPESIRRRVMALYRPGLAMPLNRPGFWSTSIPRAGMRPSPPRPGRRHRVSVHLHRHHRRRHQRTVQHAGPHSTLRRLEHSPFLRIGRPPSFPPLQGGMKGGYATRNRHLLWPNRNQDA